MSKIALVQFKASIDKKKNLPKILDYIKQAAKNNADMVTVEMTGVNSTN